MLAMVVRAHFRSYQPGDSSYNNALYVYRNRDWKHMMLRTKKKEKKNSADKWKYKCPSRNKMYNAKEKMWIHQTLTPL